MNRFTNAVVFCVFFVPTFAACKSPAPTRTEVSKPAESAPGGAPADAAQVETVTKWMEGMKSVLPSLFCKDGSYFRECFQISAQECETEAIRVTRVCIESKRDELIKNFKPTEADGKKWGEKVGECAGAAFEISYKEKRKNNPKCDDPSQWM